MKNNLKSPIIMILIVSILFFSGCTAFETYPVLYLTVNITDNGGVPTMDDGQLEMEMASQMKVPRQDQTTAYPYIAVLGYSNRSMATHLAVAEYNGNGSYLFTIPVRIDKVPKYNDTMLFEARFLNDTSTFSRAHFYAKWRWNESESDI